MRSNIYHYKVEQVLQKEEARKAKRKTLGIPDSEELKLSDLKGHISEVKKMCDDLQKAINGKDREQVMRLCHHMNNRLKFTFLHFKECR